MSIEKDNLKEKINKLKAKVSINKATNKELIRYRKYKQKYYFLEIIVFEHKQMFYKK